MCAIMWIDASSFGLRCRIHKITERVAAIYLATHACVY